MENELQIVLYYCDIKVALEIKTYLSKLGKYKCETVKKLYTAVNMCYKNPQCILITPILDPTKDLIKELFYKKKLVKTPILFYSKYPNEIKNIEYIYPFDKDIYRKIVELNLSDNTLFSEVQNLASILKRVDLKTDFFYARNGKGGLTKIYYNDILYIHRSHQKSEIVTTKNKYTYAKSLPKMLEFLPNIFIKVSAKYIINIERIRSIDKKNITILDNIIPFNFKRAEESILSIYYSKNTKNKRRRIINTNHVKSTLFDNIVKHLELATF